MVMNFIFVRIRKQTAVQDFRFPPRCRWGLRSSGLLLSVW